MPRSNASFLGQLLGTSQKITASALDDSVSASLGGSVTAYATPAALPLSGNTVGDQAFVSETGRLYIWTGTGWYNIALINTNPVITSGGESFYSLNINGTPTVVTLVANDPEGLPITWSYTITSGSLTNGGGTSATVAQADNEFTITPSTNNAYAGDFEITFTASDGINLATSASTFSLAWVTPTVEYLVVAGGGAGGYERGGGGGAGGLLTGIGFAVTSGVPIAITVGTGGVAASNYSVPIRGNDSIFSTIIAKGGGGGMSADASAGTTQTGGSGGGSAGSGYLGGGEAVYPGSTYLDQPRQGYNGGAATYSAPSYGAGGGGGSTSAGGNGTSTVAGNGGAGTTSSISGSSVDYAGGGGAGTYGSGTSGTASFGGGAGKTNSVGDSGAANTGGGGGGGGSSPASKGGDGGSGVVILRYSDEYGAAASTTGSPTITVAGGYRVYEFTQSGSITF